MEHVNFRPWVGKNYFLQGYKGKRILVLGASHYCLDELVEGGRCFPLCTKEKMQDECVNQTIYGIRGFVYNYQGDKYEQTYLCFERAVIGKEATQEEREMFWNGIVFYNYIQFNLGGPGKPIKPEYKAESELAFKEVLEEFMPDCFVIWGNELYEILPEWGGEHSLLQISEKDVTDIYTYTIQGKKIHGLLVQHPSRGKGKCWPYWHEVYEKFWKLEVK